MNLIFEETRRRRQCGSESVVNGFNMQCPFSTSKVVTIPAGLHYFDGRLVFGENAEQLTIPICKNHEMHLNNAFQKLSDQTNQPNAG